MLIPLNPGTEVVKLNTDMDGRPEVSLITCVDEAGVKEVQTVLATTFASHGQGDFFILTNKAGADLAVWLDKDADGTAPAGPIYTAAATKLKVSIVTGDTAAQVATKIKTAYDGAPLANLSCSRDTATLTFSNSKMGNAAAPVRSNSAENGNGGFTVATTVAGVASNYNSTYFTFRNGSDSRYNAWFNVNSEGVDPNPTGTEIAVAVPYASTAAQIAALVVTAVNLVSGMSAADQGNGVVQIASVALANVTDATAGTAPVSASTQRPGLSALVEAGSSPSSISNNPAVL